MASTPVRLTRPLPQFPPTEEFTLQQENLDESQDDSDEEPVYANVDVHRLPDSARPYRTLMFMDYLNLPRPHRTLMFMDYLNLHRLQ